MMDFKGHRFEQDIILTRVRFFKKAGQHGLPEKITIDESGANTAAIEALKAETAHASEIRQNTYSNTLVERDQRAVERIVKPVAGFKTFRSARRAWRGIELMHGLKKGQMVATSGQ